MSSSLTGAFWELLAGMAVVASVETGQENRRQTSGAQLPGPNASPMRMSAKVGEGALQPGIDVGKVA